MVSKLLLQCIFLFVTFYSCQFAGDRKVGKSVLISNSPFVETDSNDNVSLHPKLLTHIHINNVKYTFELLEVHSVNGLEHISSIPDVFVICFSVDSVQSFHSIKNRWYPAIKSQYPNTPILLVGTHSDTSMSSSHPCYVSTELESQMRCELDIVQCIRCSNLNRNGVERVYDEAAGAVLMRSLPVSGMFCLLDFSM